MSLALARIARRQHGVFTRRQALQVGFTLGDIEHRLVAGDWLPLMSDVLMAATTR